jgi:hypothetical protein
MGSPTTTPSAKASDLTSLTPILTAVATALGAWKLFEPKLERIRALRRETGRLEPGFRIFYQIPQYALIMVSTGVVLFLFLAFVDSFQPGFLATYFPIGLVRTALAPSNIIWIVFSIGGCGAIIYWNLISQLMLAASRLLSALPIPGIQNRFGPSGESLGWHQTTVVCEGPDKGSPLVIDDDAVDRVANGVLSRLNNYAGADDFAAEPGNLGRAEKANIALFGCIMEENFYAQRWTAPRWSEFYSALADIEYSKPMFEPSRLLQFGTGQAFFDVFRNQLEITLKARNQPYPLDRGLAAAGDMVRTWDLLSIRAKGDVLALIPRFAAYFGGRTAWLDRELREFPRLNSDGMRPQLIKLLIRWKTLPVGRGVFIQPFAKRQAWLLFQMGALRALPEVKEITFNGTGEVPIARIAALRVIKKVADLIQEGASEEALTVAARLGPTWWTRLERADFMLWSWAREEFNDARSDSWDKAKWHWKFEDDRLQRQS